MRRSRSERNEAGANSYPIRRGNPSLFRLAVEVGPLHTARASHSLRNTENTDVESIAIGSAIRDLRRLQKLYGRARWRKMKGFALVRHRSGRVRKAELHSYEAHGIGKMEFKRKRYLDLRNNDEN